MEVVRYGHGERCRFLSFLVSMLSLVGVLLWKVVQDRVMAE